MRLHSGSSEQIIDDTVHNQRAGKLKRSKDRFIDLVKNTYRVLLTRGMKGCYAHFLDKDTERFFKSRMEG